MRPNWKCWLFGHKFVQIFVAGKVEFLNDAYAKFYYRQVCDRCGYTEHGSIVGLI